jgi:ubiquinone biosynthesis protein UbiJ
MWILLALAMGLFWWGRRSRSRLRLRHGFLTPEPTTDLPEEVRVRLENVDQLESRVAELESRLDFTERLLSERRNASLGSSSA